MIARVSIALIFIFTFHAFSAPLSLDCQTSNGLEKDLMDIATATSGGSGGAERCPRPSPEGIGEFCVSAKESKPTIVNGLEEYAFQRVLRKISCVNSNDDEDVARIKIQKMWSSYATIFSCNLSGHGLPNKNVVKFVVKRSFNDLLYYLATEYQLELNVKDPDDGKTVLEFCEEEVKTRKSQTPYSESRVKDAEVSCAIIRTGKLPE